MIDVSHMVCKPIIMTVLGLAILMMIGTVAVNAQTTNTMSPQQPQPDNSCLFNPQQDKCRPNPTTGQCPPGFNMNGDEHCFPNMPCPKGFENHAEDETGACYQVTTSTTHNNITTQSNATHNNITTQSNATQ
jgi:hypothetical protein